MIERELRRASSRMPFSIRGIISGACIKGCINEGSKNDADSMPSRIAAWISKCTDLFRLYTPESGLFTKFPGSRFVQGFLRIYESAWKRPPSFERLPGALYEQN